MHTGQLPECRRLQVHVQTLALTDVRAAVGREVEDLLLADLPHGFVDRLDIVGDAGDVLNRAIVRDDHALHGIVPETEINELAEQPRADDLEFTSEYTTGIDVARKKKKKRFQF